MQALFQPFADESSLFLRCMRTYGYFLPLFEGKNSYRNWETIWFQGRLYLDLIPTSVGPEVIGRGRSSITPSSHLRWFNRPIGSVLHNNSIFSKLAQFLDRDFSQELGKHSMFPLLQYVELIFLTKLLTYLSVTCLVVARC